MVASDMRQVFDLARIDAVGEGKHINVALDVAVDAVVEAAIAPLQAENARLVAEKNHWIARDSERTDRDELQRKENARLTAQVVAGENVTLEAFQIIAAGREESITYPALEAAARRFDEELEFDYSDAATAPADAEQQVGEPPTHEYMKLASDIAHMKGTVDGALKMVKQRLDELDEWVGGIDRRFGISEKTIVGRLDELAARVDEQDSIITGLREWIPSNAVQSVLHDRIDELAARVDETDKKATDAQARIRGVEKKVSQQGSEISTHRAQFGAIKRGILKHSANFGTAMSEIFPRLTALEAARQPQTTPSAPVVTDQMVKAAVHSLFPNHHIMSETSKQIQRDRARQALEAAFAAREDGR